MKYCKVKKWHVVSIFQLQGELPKRALCGMAINASDILYNVIPITQEICISCNRCANSRGLKIKRS